MNRIKQLREEKKMTQVRLSIELNVSQESISAYEKEKNFPSYQNLIRLSEIFNASIDYIMGLSNSRFITNELTPKEAALLSQLRELSEHNYEKALSYIKGLNDSEK